MTWVRPLGWIALVGALRGVGCERPPSSEGREWTAADHDQAGATSGAGQAPKRARSAESEDAVVVETTWKMACAPCHGPTGRGDGPNGPMVQARDFSDPAWQRSANDEALASSITNGKGTKMPKFDLPDDLVKKLVVKIRSFAR